MRDLNYELMKLCHRNNDGSYATQYARKRILSMIANQLYEMGFRNMQATSLKPKHVQALVERWKAEGLSAGTIKNRMTELRWWAEKIGKQNVIAKSNDHYGIAKRQYVSNTNKARELTAEDLAKICVNKIGWHQDVFVMPDETFGRSDERILLQTKGVDGNRFRVSGGLIEWQRNVADLCRGNSRLIFAVSASLYESRFMGLQLFTR